MVEVRTPFSTLILLLPLIFLTLASCSVRPLPEAASNDLQKTPSAPPTVMVGV